MSEQHREIVIPTDQPIKLWDPDTQAWREAVSFEWLAAQTGSSVQNIFQRVKFGTLEPAQLQFSRKKFWWRDYAEYWLENGRRAPGRPPENK